MRYSGVGANRPYAVKLSVILRNQHMLSRLFNFKPISLLHMEPWALVLYNLLYGIIVDVLRWQVAVLLLYNQALGVRQVRQLADTYRARFGFARCDNVLTP